MNNDSTLVTIRLKSSEIFKNSEILKFIGIKNSEVQVIVQKLLLLGRIVKFYHRTLGMWRPDKLELVTIFEFTLKLKDEV